VFIILHQSEHFALSRYPSLYSPSSRSPFPPQDRIQHLRTHHQNSKPFTNSPIADWTTTSYKSLNRVSSGLCTIIIREALNSCLSLDTNLLFNLDKCQGFSILVLNWVRAARTRAPAATNYDVYASRRKILESPGPKCNGAGSSRPSTFWIMDTPRPGKCLIQLPSAILWSPDALLASTHMGYCFSQTFQTCSGGNANTRTNKCVHRIRKYMFMALKLRGTSIPPSDAQQTPRVAVPVPPYHSPASRSSFPPLDHFQLPQSHHQTAKPLTNSSTTDWLPAFSRKLQIAFLTATISRHLANRISQQTSAHAKLLHFQSENST
jgi:hypothetical protein